MGKHSGKYGVIDDLKTIRNWSLDELTTPYRYRASNTKQGQESMEGVKDWNGSAEFVGPIPPIMPGDRFQFLGFTAPDDDVHGSLGVSYGGFAYCESITMNWNWEAGEALNGSLTFAADGELYTYPSSAYYDLTDPETYPVCGTKFTRDGTATALDDVLSATLTITAENIAYSNSSTNCETYRKKGPIDWTLAVEIQDNIKPVSVGTSDELRLYVDATDFWLIRWGLVESYTGLTVDRDTGDIISMTMNYVMDAYDNALGHGNIRLPGQGTDWWPVAPVTTGVEVAGVNDTP